MNDGIAIFWSYDLLIRSVTLGDLWALRRKSRNQILFYNDSLLTQSHHPFWFAIRCILQGTGRDRAMIVYRERGTSALVQAKSRNGRPEQDVICLATQGNKDNALPSDYDIWFRVLEKLCFHAGIHHVQRLYAAVWEHQDEVREIFRQLGFQAYTHQIVLQLSGPDWDQGTTLSPMRVQSRRDAWAIHKLYGAVTPHLVQQVEVRSPRAWMLPLTQRWQPVSRRAWVLGSQDDICAYFQILSGPIAHVLTLLVHPDAYEHTTDILRFGLAQLFDSRPVYLMLREYHQELLTPLQSLGFQPVSEQTLLVKHLVVPIRRPRLLPAFETQSLEAQITIPTISGEESHNIWQNNLK